MSLLDDRAAAEAKDRDDPLRSFRDRFVWPDPPKGPDGERLDELLYFTGNSLGLMPKAAKTYVDEELEAWGRLGVDGHFEGKRPWYSYHEQFTEKAARLVGAKPGEVVVMNSLTVNVHLLMVSFYRPTAERFRIVIEDHAFPSDRYAVETQAAFHAQFHGFDINEAIVPVRSPAEGSAEIPTAEFERVLDELGDSVALVLLGGVNFYSGQAYDLAAIAKKAHEVGAVFGTDLAHAAGNLNLSLHDDDVDFAAFCTYKYLNAGPGSVAGAFVHQKHANRPELPRFAGWWGNDPDTRFQMQDGFVPQPGAAGWQISNAPVLSMAAVLASVDMFDEVGMPALRAKSERLTAYLIELIDEINAEQQSAGQDPAFSLITPRDPAARGAQLSIRARGDAKALRDLLQQRGVVSDFRPPDVIRVAPVPLYNSFLDVWKLAQILRASVG